MTTKIALFDWDGTIRRDFTINTWIEFLTQYRIVTEDTIKMIKDLFAVYSKRQLSHDQLSDSTANIYALSLKNYENNYIYKLADQFFIEDQKLLFSFSEMVFSFLRDNDIEVIVISGAPIEVLSQYQRRFYFREIYALESQIEYGKYTGKVKQNTGTSQAKKDIINQLLNSKKYKVVLAAGNSESDIPLFDAAPNNIIVNNSKLMTNKKSFYLNDNNNESSKLLTFLKEELR